MDEKKQEVFYTEEDHWNFTCKPYQFKNWWIDSNPLIDFDYVIIWYGWNYFIGKKVVLNDKDSTLLFIK